MAPKDEEQRMRASIVRALALVLVPWLCTVAGYGGEDDESPLLKPQSPIMNRMAPTTFKVRFETSKGDFIVEVQRAWAPQGADRFYNLVKNGFYDGARFFRVISGFMAQFGINGDPKVSALWREQRITDDPVQQSNTRGFISYAMAGPNTRTTQLFINYGDNSRLDQRGFAPFGRVIEGMEVVEQLYAAYGEGAPQGRGPSQARIQQEGNAYLNGNFPNLDYIKKATLIE
jgi:peptidyl-prolyl cis-trans isomerase A (cyclophilin A)